MSAKEMFKEIGYKEEKIIQNFFTLDLGYILYKRDNEYIEFESNTTKSVMTINKYSLNWLYKKINRPIYAYELKAINKQIEELGWNE